MTTTILNEDSQQRILLTYQKDYGILVQAYNRLAAPKNSAALGILKMQAELLCKEILNDACPRKRFFNEENADFAHSVVSAIKNFISTCLSDNKNNNNIVKLPELAVIKFVPNNFIKPGYVAV